MSNVTEDIEIIPRTLFRGLGRELGIRPYFVYVPGSMVLAGARLGEILRVGVRGTPGLYLSRAARLALDDYPYPADKARKTMGRNSPFSLEEALARTGSWLRERK